MYRARGLSRNRYCVWKGILPGSQGTGRRGKDEGNTRKDEPE